jgi:hypothetical protein
VTYLKYLTFVMLILGFFLLRPYHMQSTGLMYSGDDEGYLAHATALSFFKFPSYKYENYTPKLPVPQWSVGPGLMALPFVFAGSLIDRITGLPITQQRTKDVLYKSWSLFGFMISTMFYFYLGFFLLYKGLLYYFEDKTAFLSILCMIFFQVFGLYIFRRPVFSHIYEFFLHSVCIYILLKDAKTGFLENVSVKFNMLLGIVIGLMFLVRYNNIPIALMWPIVLFCFRSEKFEFKKYIKNFIIIFAAAGLIIFLFKIIPMIYNHVGEAYSNQAGNAVFKTNLFNLLQRLWLAFFGIDFGVLFTAPFALIGFIFVFFYKGIFKKRIVLLLLPLIFNLFFAISWYGTTQGCWYGYRYFLFSLIPIVLIPLTVFIEKCVSRFGIKKASSILFCIAVVPVVSMFSFEGNNNTLTLILNGEKGWSNPTYQLEIWKMIFLHPAQYMIVLFKGCALYLVYLTAHFAGFGAKLPYIILEKYPIFSSIILIKVFIIFMFPLFMYFIIFKKKI